jgi:hypothetical protein
MSRSLSDPTYLFAKSIRLLGRALLEIQARAKSDDGLTARDAESLVSISNALAKFSRMSQEDEVRRLREVKNMSDEQLAAAEAKLARKVHGEAVREGMEARNGEDSTDP